MWVAAVGILRASVCEAAVVYSGIPTLDARQCGIGGGGWYKDGWVVRQCVDRGEGERWMGRRMSPCVIDTNRQINDPREL